MSTPSHPNKRIRGSESPETDNKNKQRNKIVKMDVQKLYETMIEQFAKITDTIKENSTKLDEIVAEFRTDLKTVKHRLSDAEMRLNDLEQANLSSSFMITGLPVLQNTTPLEVTKIILEKIGSKIEVDDLKRVSLIKYRSGTGSFVIANLWSEYKKNEIVKKFKGMLKDNKPLIINEVFPTETGIAQQGRQIRIKNLLTKQNAALLKQAQTFKNKPFAHVWEINGKIMLRRAEGDRPIIAKSLAQITELAAMEN
jgi:hypothetical protein